MDGELAATGHSEENIVTVVVLRHPDERLQKDGQQR